MADWYDSLNISLLIQATNVHADSAYLKDPPSGYQEPAVDIFAALDAIKTKINGTYANEHEFQEDLFLTFASVHDGHFRFSPDGLTRALSFGRTVPIVSVSLDGVELPKVYSYGKSHSWAINQPLTCL